MKGRVIFFDKPARAALGTAIDRDCVSLDVVSLDVDDGIAVADLKRGPLSR